MQARWAAAVIARVSGDLGTANEMSEKLGLACWNRSDPLRGVPRHTALGGFH
jgi:hypothetical protein